MKIIKSVCFYFFCIAILIFSCHTVFAEQGSRPEKLVLVYYSELSPYVAAACRRFFGKISKRIGIPIVLENYPAKRASFYADNGMVDGEAARVTVYNSVHKELVRVEEPLMPISFSAYAVTPGISLNGWESLQGNKFIIEYTLGNMLADFKLKKHAENERLMTINDQAQGLEMLIAGRVDILISDEINMVPMLKAAHYRGKGLYKAGLMEKTALHIFLIKRHKGLAKEISAAIRTLKSEGLADNLEKIIFNKKALNDGTKKNTGNNNNRQPRGREDNPD